MPKAKQSVCGRLESCVTEFGSDIFSIVGNYLFCKVCEIRISSEKNLMLANILERINNKNLSKDTKKKTITFDHFAF